MKLPIDETMYYGEQSLRRFAASIAALVWGDWAGKCLSANDRSLSDLHDEIKGWLADRVNNPVGLSMAERIDDKDSEIHSLKVDINDLEAAATDLRLEIQNLKLREERLIDILHGLHGRKP